MGIGQRIKSRLTRQQGEKPPATRRQLLYDPDEFIHFDSPLFFEPLECFLGLLVLTRNFQLPLPVVLLRDCFAEIAPHCQELAGLGHDLSGPPSFDQGIEQSASFVDVDQSPHPVLPEALASPDTLDCCSAMRHEVLEDSLLFGLGMLPNFFQHNYELLDKLASPPAIRDRHQSPELTHRLEVDLHALGLKTDEMASDPLLNEDGRVELQLSLDLLLLGLVPELLDLLLPLQFEGLLLFHLSPVDFLLVDPQRRSRYNSRRFRLVQDIPWLWASLFVLVRKALLVLIGPWGGLWLGLRGVVEEPVCARSL